MLKLGIILCTVYFASATTYNKKSGEQMNHKMAATSMKGLMKLIQHRNDLDRTNDNIENALQTLKDWEQTNSKELEKLNDNTMEGYESDGLLAIGEQFNTDVESLITKLNVCQQIAIHTINKNINDWKQNYMNGMENIIEDFSQRTKSLSGETDRISILRDTVIDDASNAYISFISNYADLLLSIGSKYLNTDETSKIIENSATPCIDVANTELENLKTTFVHDVEECKRNSICIGSSEDPAYDG